MMQIRYNIEPLFALIEEKFQTQLDRKIDRGLVLAFGLLKVQIEFIEDRILFSCILGELLPSRFRMQVFEDALRANFKSSTFGSLGYNDRNKLFMLILNYPIIPPREAEFIFLLDGFFQKAQAWSEALKASNTRLLV